MNLTNIRKFDNTRFINTVNNLNDFFVEIDYFDKTGIINKKNKVPLAYILNKKSIKISNIK